MKLTVAFITKSEKINQQILNATQFADEVIVVVDAIIKKPKRIGKVTYFYQPLQNNFASQRNFALEKAQNDWVMFVDADEFVGSELSREIKLLKPDPTVTGYKLRRIDVCFHQPLLHGETGHTKLLRLARKNGGKFERPVHETWKISGRVEELTSPLYHLKDRFVSEFIGRMSHYSDIDSTILTLENKPFAFWRLLLNPKAKFVQNYFVRLGILDGTIGLFVAYLMSVQSLTVRVFQWTKRK
jgi:glycosyltransferase involved in cell wall biosynthesis